MLPEFNGDKKSLYVIHLDIFNKPTEHDLEILSRRGTNREDGGAYIFSSELMKDDIVRLNSYPNILFYCPGYPTAYSSIVSKFDRQGVKIYRPTIHVEYCYRGFDDRMIKRFLRTNTTLEFSRIIVIMQQEYIEDFPDYERVIV